MRVPWTRAIALAGVLACAGLSWGQLAEHLRWQGYAGLAQEIRQGRFVPGDLELLGPALELPPPRGCARLDTSPLVLLHLHAADLQAWLVGVDPLAPSADPALAARRAGARDLVERALACRPVDGNLWLTRALLSRALDEPPGRTARYLGLSVRHAPHEGWIARRRDGVF